MKGAFQLVFTIIIMIVAFIFHFFFPDASSYESIAISILSFIGMITGVDWRLKYLELKNWLKSKTILGTMIYFIPTMVILITPVIKLNIPDEIREAILYLIGAGGLTFIIGVIDAVRKKSNIISN